jgi:histone H3
VKKQSETPLNFLISIRTHTHTHALAHKHTKTTFRSYFQILLKKKSYHLRFLQSSYTLSFSLSLSNNYKTMPRHSRRISGESATYLKLTDRTEKRASNKPAAAYMNLIDAAYMNLMNLPRIVTFVAPTTSPKVTDRTEKTVVDAEVSTNDGVSVTPSSEESRDVDMPDIANVAQNNLKSVSSSSEEEEEEGEEVEEVEDETETRTPSPNSSNNHPPSSSSSRRKQSKPTKLVEETVSRSSSSSSSSSPSTIKEKKRNALSRKITRYHHSISKGSKNTAQLGAKKRRRFSQKTLCRRSMVQLQKSTDLIIPKAPFRRLVREITQSYTSYRIPDIRIKKAALVALHEASENYLNRILAGSTMLAYANGRSTLMARDLECYLRIVQFNGKDVYYGDARKSIALEAPEKTVGKTD